MLVSERCRDILISSLIVSVNLPIGEKCSDLLKNCLIVPGNLLVDEKYDVLKMV